MRRAVCVVAIALALAANGCERWQKPPRPPLVLLISLDTVRADHLGSYGYTAPTTPELDAFARDAVRFDQAIVQQPHTLHSHMSMLTGLYPRTHTVTPDRPLPRHHATLAEHLTTHGYATHAFATDILWFYARYGFDRGFRSYTLGPNLAEQRTESVLRFLDQRDTARGYVRKIEVGTTAVHAKSDHVVTPLEPLRLALRERGTVRIKARAANGTLEVRLDGGPAVTLPPGDAFADLIVGTTRNRGAELQVRLHPAESPKSAEAPLLLFVHYYDVHSDTTHLPYDAPEHLRRLVGGEGLAPVPSCNAAGHCATTYLMGLTAGSVRLPPADMRALIAAYDAGLRYTDLHVGALLDGLRERGLYDDALIIVTADHGEEFYDHGKYLHTQLYDETIRVPLLVKLPRRREAGRVVDAQVQSIDLLPTIVELVGAPPLPGVEGRSFVKLLSGDHLPPRHGFIEGGGSHAVRSTEWKLLRNDGTEGLELYRLASDAEERRDLAADPAVTDHRRALLDRLNAWEAATRGPDAETAAGAVGLSPEERARLESLGYVID